MLLAISLDSECLPWLEDHMASGDLPNLASLATTGVKLPVEAAPLAGIAYPTLYTGRAAADVGVYFPVQWRADQQKTAPWTEIEKPATIFERIDAAGGRVVLLDPPECAPLSLKNGFAASGIQFRARVLLHPWISNQSEFGGVISRIGPAPRADEVFGRPAARELRALRRSLLGAPDRLGAAALHFLKESRADCLWLNCCGMHLAAHQFFELSLVECANRERLELEHTRLGVAQGYDAMIGRLLDKMPPFSDVMVFYGKGMGRAHGWVDLLPTMLRRVLKIPDRLDGLALFRDLAPRSLRGLVANALSESWALRMTARAWSPRAHWPSTRAFCLPSDLHGFIRVNLRGREREGIVAEAEAPALLQEIGAGLETFTDLDGEPVVDRISSAAELIGGGSRIGDFPDLIVNWKRKPNLTGDGVRSSRFGVILRTGVGTGRSGTHGPGALALLALSGKEPRSDGIPARIVDIAATTLACAGVKYDDLPGRPLFSHPEQRAIASGSGCADRFPQAG